MTRRTNLLTLACMLTAGLCAHEQGDSLRNEKKYRLDEVVVTGTRNETDIRHLPMTITVVDREKLEQTYRPNILPTLNELVPGLFSTSRSTMGYGVSTGAAGGMTLRGIGGSPTAGLLVLIDGHPQYMGIMGHPIADAYQTMLAERVEVLRNPASVLYGSNAMGGVINIVTRKVEEDGQRSDIQMSGGSYGTFQSEITSRGRQGRFTNIVSGSYNRSDGHRSDMGFEQYAGYAKVGLELSDNWRLWGDANITRFYASNPGTVSSPLLDNDSRIDRGMASAALENHYRRTSGALSFFYNWGQHRINDGYAPGSTPQEAIFHSKDRMMGISWYQSATLFEGNRLTVGIDYQHFGGETWDKVIETGEEIPDLDKSMDEVAGYIDLRQDIRPWLTLNAGLRVDHHSHTGTELVPQGGLAFRLPRQSELRAMVSKGFRNPTIRELYFLPPKNDALAAERLVSYELSFAQRLLADRLNYSVSLFYINGDNIITTVPVDGRPRFMNTGEIENWGAEAQVSYRLSARWSLNANYSWLHMEQPVISSPEHKLYAGADYRHGRWTLSTGIQFVDDLYTTVGKDAQTETFTLWNMQAGYRFNRFIHLFAKGENLLAQRYETMAGYPMPRATFMGGIRLSL